GAVIGHAGGVVERVHGAEDELDIALGINVVQSFQDDLAGILHVDIFIHHHNAFREHRLAEGPDGVHHFAGLAGIGLADGDDHQVVKNAFDGEIDVHELGNGETHERQEDAFDGFAHPAVFHGRLADYGRRVDWVFAMRDTGDVKNWVQVFQGVKAGVIAERTLGPELVQIDVAFE